MKLDPKKTVLLVIDMQKDFYGSEGDAVRRGKQVLQMQNLVQPINEFIKVVRKKGVLIVFTKFIANPNITPKNLAEVAEKNGYKLACQTGTGGEELDGMKTESTDIIIEKPHYDAFAYTNLLEQLKNKSIENVLICGVKTEACVDVTAKRSASEGFRTFIISDLIGTNDDRQEFNINIPAYFNKYYGFSLNSSDLYF